MSYKQAIIYYWSGTGNTLRISKWVYDFLKTKVSDIRISSIRDANPSSQIEQGEYLLFIIAMPTHGLTAPWPVIKFCLRLPFKKKMHALTIANGAGYSYFGCRLPGCTASANFVISLILLLKGYRLQGCVGIDMPGSWPAVCPSLKEDNIKYFLEKAKAQTEAFIKTILSGRKHIIKTRNIVEFIIGFIFIPISFGYLLYGRFFLAKLQFANLKCKSCGICFENCSHNAILMKGKPGLTKPYWTFKCESCGRCISYCPQSAIETGHSMAILIWYATTLRTSFHFIDYFFESPAVTSFIGNRYIVLLSNYLSYLLIIFLCYYVLYYLVKIPFINNIFAFTSGTHWWSKYHESSVHLQDFKSIDFEGNTEGKYRY